MRERKICWISSRATVCSWLDNLINLKLDYFQVGGFTRGHVKKQVATVQGKVALGLKVFILHVLCLFLRPMIVQASVLISLFAPVLSVKETSLSKDLPLDNSEQV